MIIEVKQKKLSIGNHYTVLVDDVETYKASGHTFPIVGGTISVNDLDGTQCCSIKRKLSLFKPFYTFKLKSGATYEFKSINILKGVYICTGGGSQYTYYKHKGHLASIFKNNLQIGSIVRDPVKILKGDNYHILVDDDADIDLITSLVIIFDDYMFKGSNHDIGTIDLGNILFEEKEFDESWTPRIVKR